MFLGGLLCFSSCYSSLRCWFCCCFLLCLCLLSGINLCLDFCIRLATSSSLCCSCFREECFFSKFINEFKKSFQTQFFNEDFQSILIDTFLHEEFYCRVYSIINVFINLMNSINRSAILLIHFFSLITCSCPVLHWFPNVSSSILNSYIIPWITITRGVGVWSSDLIRSFRKNLFSNTSFLILASLSSNCLDSLGPQLHLLAVLCLVGRSW